MACGVLALSVAGCAAPGQVAQNGPTFIEMPLNQSGLVGATPQLLNAAFGKPAILRVEGTAQVWLYHDAGCGLNLVLYPDNAGTPRVAMAAPTGDGGDPAACSAVLERDHVAGLSRPVASYVLPVQASAPGPSAAGPSLDGPGSAL
jgi:hypothetical protein